MSYATDIFGNNAMLHSYCADIYAELILVQIHRLSYKSNWRVLHIDGFEGMWALDSSLAEPRKIGFNIALGAPYNFRKEDVK